MTASAHDIAAQLRAQLPGLGKKQLHKLLYYCQGHYLAAFGRPLFSEAVVAFDHGPVVRQFWEFERYGGEEPEPTPLDEAELNFIGYVVSRYGHYNGTDLERLTHAETPWIAADQVRKLGGSDEIQLDWMRTFFVADANTVGEDEPPMEFVRAWLASQPRSTGPGRPDDINALVAKLANA